LKESFQNGFIHTTVRPTTAIPITAYRKVINKMQIHKLNTNAQKLLEALRQKFIFVVPKHQAPHLRIQKFQDVSNFEE